MAPSLMWPVIPLCAMLMAGSSQAESLVLPSPPADVWFAVSDHTLDLMRGGFDLGSGLVVSFGISRVVYLNGQLMTSTSFQMSDITRMTPMQASALGRQMATQAQIVQNGPGNAVATDAALVPLATYIQNTLNNQTIRTQTLIEANTNSLGLLKNINLQATINDAVANAIGKR